MFGGTGLSPHRALAAPRLIGDLLVQLCLEALLPEAGFPKRKRRPNWLRLSQAAVRG